MALLHQCGNGHWMGSLDSECVNGKELVDCKKKHQLLQTAGKDHQLGKLDGVPQREIETDGQKERERGKRRIKA